MPSGEPVSKAVTDGQSAREWRSPVTFSEQSVRVFGETAVCRPADGFNLVLADRSVDQRFLRVFAKRGSRWQAVSRRRFCRCPVEGVAMRLGSSAHGRAQCRRDGRSEALRLAQLPALVDELQRRWGVTVRKAMPNATEAYVAATVSSQGWLRRAQGPDARRGQSQARTGRAAGGARRARLCEGASARSGQRGHAAGAAGTTAVRTRSPDPRSKIEVICATRSEAWRTPPLGLDLMTGAEKADSPARAAARLVAPRSPTACAARTIDVALRAAEQRRAAFDPSCVRAWPRRRPLLEYAVRSGFTGGFKFVDPVGSSSNALTTSASRCGSGAPTSWLAMRSNAATRAATCWRG